MKYTMLGLFVSLFFYSCSKEGNGMPEPQGGQLPTNYIIIKDGSFSPTNSIAVRGSSFTFVNQSGSSKGIYSTDSIVINKQNIDNNTSYFLKKDTAATINFFMAGKPSINGSITLIP